MSRSRILSIGRGLVLAISLAGLAAPMARAQFPMFALYPQVQPVWAHQAAAQDRFDDQFVVAGLHQVSTWPNATPQLALDLILRPVAGPTLRYLYLADFLTFKYSDFEMVAVATNPWQYAVFLNHYGTQTHAWSTYVFFISRSDPTQVSAVRLLGTNGQMVRLRAVAAMKASFGILGTLDDGTILGSPTFLGLLGSSGLAWARQYSAAEQIELGSLTVDGQGLVAGGWISDFDSWDIGEAVMLKAAISDGSVLAAKHYEDVYTNLTMPVQSRSGISGGDNLVHAVAKSGGPADPYDLTFFSVDPGLQPVAAARVWTNGDLTPIDLAHAQDGVSLTIVSGGGGGAQYLLRLDQDPTSLVGSAELYDLATMPGGWQGADLRTLDQGPNGVVAAGSLLLTLGSNFDTTLVATTGPDGIPDYCIDHSSLAAPAPVAITARDLRAAWAIPVDLTGYSPMVYGFGPYDVEEEQICH